MKISLKRLNENDWREFSQMRLTALQTDPQVFGSNYERELTTTEAEWRAKLRAQDNAIFLIYDGETPIGITCVSVDRQDATGKTALLWGSWLAPSFRRQGLSELIFHTRLEWSKTQPTVERVIISHRASNLAAQTAIRKQGFLETHREDFVWADGETESLVSYELKIKS